MEKYIELQMFAEVESAESAKADASTGTEGNTANEPGKESKAEAKYTDADVDKLISQKFAEWQTKQEKKISEAQRLANMTAEEKNAERMKALEARIQEYERDAARADMTKQARAMLQESNIHVDDALIANLIADNAENTKKAVETFTTAFSAAVEKAVKDRVKSEPPKTGGSSGMTAEQIMKVTNRAERQRLINENLHLFK